MHITSILGIDRKLHEDCYIITILLDCRRTAIINSLKYFIFLIIFYYMFVGNLFLLRLGFFLYCILNLVLISYFSIYIFIKNKYSELLKLNDFNEISVLVARTQLLRLTNVASSLYLASFFFFYYYFLIFSWVLYCQ
jgi:hypothetical protein